MQPSNQTPRQPETALADPAVDGPPPVGEDGASRPAPAWRRRLDAAVGRAVGNPVVSQALAVVAAANEAAAPLFAAALAFSTLFAAVPLLLLLAGVLGWLIDDPVQRNALLAQLVGYMPPLAEVLEQSLEGVVRQRGALSVIGLVGLIWGSSAFYSGLDEVMRRIFPGGGPRGEISRRVRGALTVVVLVTLVVGTILLSGVWALLSQVVGAPDIWRWTTPGIALAVMSLVVFAVYRFVPTSPPSWRAALLPAIVAGVAIGVLTNVFSVLTPLLIGGLAGFGVLATVFGALVWLNFSYQILFYGAAWARVRRDREVEATVIASA